jgi:hypothetical protein
MGMSAFKAVQALTLGFILTLVTEIGAVSAPSTPRSYALFSASYNTANNEAVGGVAGTVFFISPTEAVTAYHVVNASSFKAQKGFKRRKLWLVHEGQEPIELKREHIREDRLRDLTVIRLPKRLAVSSRFVFERAGASLNADVTSEGFRANSTGPILERRGRDLVVASVPRLERLFASGKVVRRAQVDLKAEDVNLKNSPGLELSYAPVKGMSGGPVLAGGKVIAMNSFADPRNFRRTWALEIQPGASSLIALP